MSMLIALSLLWIGAAEPVDVAQEFETVAIEQIETVAFEHIADPVSRWRPLVAEYFPADEVDTAMCIIGRESGGEPEADNPRSTASGLFQILGSLWAPHYGVSTAELFDPEINVSLAADIWRQSGWWAWSPYVRGSCR